MIYDFILMILNCYDYYFQYKVQSNTVNDSLSIAIENELQQTGIKI